MSTKFFTNDNQNTLLEKFKGVFKYNSDIEQFDTLVGYFRSTGYFKIRPYLENVPEIRILVGINVDALIAKYQNEGLLLKLAGDSEETKKDYCEQLKNEIDNAYYSSETEASILQFVKDIGSGKIQIRAHPTRKLHAKIYIFRPKNFNPHSSCEVITGSSNLTEAGLGATDSNSGDKASNYEFNVSLREYEDVKFATDEFEKLWVESVEILPAEIKKVQNKTFLREGAFTSFELYIKLLIEYFGREIEFDPSSIKDLPPGFMRLTYQLDAVNQGLEILRKHNGFFLSDVVGLGKTVVAILIARQYFYYNNFPDYRSRTLIVTPPALQSNWREIAGKFRLDNAHYITNGSLHKIDNPSDYDLVIVDEAHKFRNDTSEAYVHLQSICKTPCQDGQMKKIILVSATPLNNRPSDIKNQVLLFQDASNTTLDVNIGQFFARVDKEFNALIRDESKEITKAIEKIYTEIRNKIVEPLMVRRTRTDLKEHKSYSRDISKQGIIFPEVKKPQALLYQLNSDLNSIYDKTVNLIANSADGLSYTRYRILQYLIPEHREDYRSPDLISNQLAAIMKTLLIKRLDSSFHAFFCSLGRFVDASQAMLQMIKNNRIFIAPDFDVAKYILDEEEEELLERLVSAQLTDPNIKILSREDFEPDFIKGMERDHKILTYLYNEWKKVVTHERDPKLDKLLAVLDKDLLDRSRNPEQKLVIFSESLETTNYLKKQLHDVGYQKVLAVDSSNVTNLKDIISVNFDANVNFDRRRSDYNIIITTEVLSEGVNLHRSNTILNYDTPWNSTRLMQRIGRINRIGSTAQEIYIYNFFPTAKVEDDIQLYQRASMKLQAFHSALGEDSQIYSPDEKVSTLGLFDKNIYEEGDKVKVNERLQYLMEIRKFREESPEKFNRIKNLPLKMRTTVTNEQLQGSTLAFLRSGNYNAFYHVADNDEDPKELGFLEAASVFKSACSSNTEQLYERHHEQVKKALRCFEQQLKEKIVRDKQIHSLNPQQTRAISYLKPFLNMDVTGNIEKDKINNAIKLIEIGRFQNLHKDINRLARSSRKAKVKISIVLEKLLNIIDKHVKQDTRTSSKPAYSDRITTSWKYEDPKIVVSQSYISSS